MADGRAIPDPRLAVFGNLGLGVVAVGAVLFLLYLAAFVSALVAPTVAALGV